MEYNKIVKEIKGKDRRLHFNQDLNLYKRRRTFNGIRCLPQWSVLKDHIDLDSPVNCIEIGSHEGQSAVYFLKHILKHQDSKLLCVDPWIKSHWLKMDPSGLCYEDIFDLNMLNDTRNQVTKYRGLNSDYYKSNEDDLFDIAYIDDIHTYESTTLNCSELYPRMKSGGIMIFDDYDGDYCDPEDPKAGHHWTDPVKQAVDEFILKYQDNLEILYREYQLIVKKLS